MNSYVDTESGKEIRWVEGPSGDIARRLALDAVNVILAGRGDSDRTVDRFIRRYRLKGHTRSFFTNLVYGTVRMKGALDYVLELYSRRKMEKTEDVFANILRLGAFQILYTDGVPPYAAVDESVELARTVSREWAAGAVNAILRRVAAEKALIRWPSPDKGLVEHIAFVHSYPRWMVERLIQQYGPDEAHALARAMNEIPVLTIRVNTLRKAPEYVYKILRRKYGNVQKGRYLKEAIRLEGVSVTDLVYYLKKGSFHVQDEGSMLVSLLVKPRSGLHILDMCAAPGGKTSYIAALTDNRARIWAADRNWKRLQAMKKHMKELGVRVGKYVYADMTGIPHELKGKKFHRILIDAPCSGTGTIRRNPEIKWRASVEELEKLAGIQLRLLKNALKMLRDDGFIVYVTCSILSDENEKVIEQLMEDEKVELVTPDFGSSELNKQLLGEESYYVRLLPHRHGTDGFFAAVLRRR